MVKEMKEDSTGNCDVSTAVSTASLDQTEYGSELSIDATYFDSEENLNTAMDDFSVRTAVSRDSINTALDKDDQGIHTGMFFSPILLNELIFSSRTWR